MIKGCGFYTSIPNSLNKPCRVFLNKTVVSLLTARIDKVVFWIFPLLLLSMPLYFMGSLMGLFTVKINRSNLSKKPSPVPVPSESKACDNIDLLTQPGVYDSLDGKKDRFVKGGSQYYSDVEKQISLYLRCICKKIKEGEVSENLLDKIRKDMNEAFSHCRPTWLEVAMKCYDEVMGNTAGEETLRHVREYKEDLIKEMVQIDFNKGHWHGLNYIREKIGREIGLDPKKAEGDEYTHSSFSLSLPRFVCKFLFLTKYSDTERLISAVQNRINAKIDQDGYSYAYKFFDYVRDQYRSSNPKIDVETAIEYVGGTFFDEELRITQAGTIYLLRTIGILT